MKLNDSAKNRTMGDVPICTMLSGGIDSVLTTFYVYDNINFKKVSFFVKFGVCQGQGRFHSHVSNGIEVLMGRPNSTRNLENSRHS